MINMITMGIEINSKIKYPILAYAPGNYLCMCSLCKEEFIGDKRAVMCESCAINKLKESHDILLVENRKLKTLIEELNNVGE